jgi:hypothetical protein
MRQHRLPLAALARLGLSVTLSVALTLAALALEMGGGVLLSENATFAEGIVRPGAELGVAPPQTQPTLEQSLRSFSFLNGVGGVAFGGTAVASTTLKVTNLTYLPDAPDGQRLRVTLATGGAEAKDVTAAIYDWQLLPIAAFADSTNYTCFTLFGHLVDRKSEQEHRRQGHDILNYHPALADSLLGLRMMQADILMLYPEACDLPKEDGRYLLGAGEKAPEVDANRQRQSRLRTFLDSLPGGPFQSYVICDDQQVVRIGVAQGALTLTGNPYWYCWRLKARGKAFEDAQRLANAEGGRLLEAETKAARATLPPQEFAEKYSNGSSQQRYNEIVEKQISARLIQPMPEFSRSVSAQIKFLEGVNPPVYEALVVTMRYAAFFRHVKAAAPQVYARFVESLPHTETLAGLKTPTVFVRPSAGQGRPRPAD